ncbi:hypothetical protein PSV09DRAFT_1211161 [Bipolaris maydis]|nr:hypothetical protein PSV09DRAFT_1211161 [Bipolaris maydis]
MLGSLLLPTSPPGPRGTTYSPTAAPPLPPRRNSLSTQPAAKTAAKTAPLHIKTVKLSGAMDSRYTRPSSPRRAYGNPARASTGGFSDPYYDSSYYARPSSPRASVDRLAAASSIHSPYWNQPTASLAAARTSNLKYDSYTTTRPRRNTNDLSRPNVSTSALPQTSLPLRTPYSPHTTTHADRPRSPLTSSYDKRADTYITSAPSRSHKKVYSVDDTSHLTKLVAEVDASRHRDHADRGYNVTSGGRTYHDSKPSPRLSDMSNDGYSYTDPASMYRDTEPAWRRPRAGSIERTSRPTSMIADRPPRTSTRELGPPPSTRGFDKIHSAPRVHGRSSSIDRTPVPKYDPYPDAHLGRSSSTRSRAPAAVHQESREHRRDTYRDDYDRRDVENKRHNTTFEDRDDLASPPLALPPLAHDHHALDRQPLYPPQEPPRPRVQEPATSYYQPERAEARMPEARMPEVRSSRDRDVPPPDYDRRPRERDHGKHDKYEGNGFVPTAAGAVAGVAATLGAASYMKAREKERGSDRDSSGERERERRKEYDERDRRDRPDERRERKSEGRRNSLAPAPAPAVAAPVAAAAAAATATAPPPAPPAQIAAPDYPAYPDPDRKYRDRRQDDDKDKVPVSSRKAPSPEGSGDERPRHYVDRDAERRKEPAPQPAAVDPDEEYRRRIQQEAERAGRSNRDRESDSDREKDRRRRKEERERSRSRGREEPSRASPPRDAPSSRDERSLATHNGGMVQEPETLDKESEPASKSVQIVEPPKEPVAPVKGILRKPTAKFPEDPEPIREGVAPHKDALKGKDIPVGARWTRIDRRLVNPEALEQAKERFEERMDCVIVLRVLTKEEIQKLADRTRKIRESREDDEYDHERREREDRDRRSRRSKDDRDDEDRDDDRYHHERERRRRYDDESDYEGRDRSKKHDSDDGR